MQERTEKQSWAQSESEQSVNWPCYYFCYRGTAAARHEGGGLRPSVSMLYPPPPLGGPVLREIDDQYVHVCAEILIMCENSFLTVRLIISQHGFPTHPL